MYAIVQPDGAWGLSNVGLISASDRSVLVDTFFTERRNVMLRELTDSLAAVSPSLLVNTHHHGDHVHGNGFFPEALVVAHRSTREAIVKLDPSVSARRFPSVTFGETRPTVPSLTFEQSLSIHVGDEMVLDVFYPGVAHCPGNTAVFVRGRGVLIAGDLLLKDCTPTFVGGSAVGFHAVLEQLRSLEPEVVIPGHGPVCGPEVIGETERYVDFVLEVACAALSNGQTPLEAAFDADLGEFATWHDSERLVGNLYRAMGELDGGRPVDFPAMWRDSEEFRGGPPQSRA
ncbi:MBL fold metallo-hydrolase [Rhodococcus koreensis]